MAERLRLKVIAGPETGREILIPSTGRTIGRDPSADVVLAERALSRTHCRIYRDDHGWVVEDLDSKNGTLVHNTRLAEAELRTGDVIRLGQTELRVECIDSQDSDGPPPEHPSEAGPTTETTVLPRPAEPSVPGPTEASGAHGASAADPEPSVEPSEDELADAMALCSEYVWAHGMAVFRQEQANVCCEHRDRLDNDLPAWAGKHLRPGERILDVVYREAFPPWELIYVSTDQRLMALCGSTEVVADAVDLSHVVSISAPAELDGDTAQRVLSSAGNCFGMGVLMHLGVGVATAIGGALGMGLAGAVGGALGSMAIAGEDAVSVAVLVVRDAGATRDLNIVAQTAARKLGPSDNVNLRLALEDFVLSLNEAIQNRGQLTFERAALLVDYWEKSTGRQFEPLPEPHPQPRADVPAGQLTLKDRLQQLRDAREAELLTEEEYEQKRQALLAEF